MTVRESESLAASAEYNKVTEAKSKRKLLDARSRFEERSQCSEFNERLGPVY